MQEPLCWDVKSFGYGQRNGVAGYMVVVFLLVFVFLLRNSTLMSILAVSFYIHTNNEEGLLLPYNLRSI